MSKENTNVDKSTQAGNDAKLPMGRSFTNVFVEINDKPIPIRELPKIEYEEFLEAMHRLRLAYIAVVSR